MPASAVLAGAGFFVAAAAVKRSEKALVALTAFVIGGFVGLLVTGAATWLNAQPWFYHGSNVIQWASGPSTFAGVAMLVYWRWTHRCAAPRCVRLGEHPVAGTRKRVCHRHHSTAMHELVHDLHRVEGMLGWGESHKRPV